MLYYRLASNTFSWANFLGLGKNRVIQSMEGVILIQVRHDHNTIYEYITINHQTLK